MLSTKKIFIFFRLYARGIIFLSKALVYHYCCFFAFCCIGEYISLDLFCFVNLTSCSILSTSPAVLFCQPHQLFYSVNLTSSNSLIPPKNVGFVKWGTIRGVGHQPLPSPHSHGEIDHTYIHTYMICSRVENSTI